MTENNKETVNETTNESSNQTDNTATSTGLDQNIAGLLTYLFGIITGIIFVVIEKENRFVRFHAWQSIFVWAAIFITFIVLFIGGFIIGLIPGIGWILGIFIWLFEIVLGLGTFILWIFLMIQAFQNKEFKLPLIGEYAEKQVNK